MILSLMSCLWSFIFVLIAVAFFTLLERKGLSYFQVRKGPNKVGVMGLLQPMADAVKLFFKEMVFPSFSNKGWFLVAPLFLLAVALMMWIVNPYSNVLNYIEFSFLLFLCISSLNVYGLMMAGWTSNSKYALLGSMRGVAQIISYEVSMSIIMLLCFFLVGSFMFDSFVAEGFSYWKVMPFMALMFIASVMAETNRAPFDFAEGESELVSGFNVEYSGPPFALIFMAEYANILFMSVMISMIWFGSFYFFGVSSPLILNFKLFFFAFLFIWSRATLPRFRYDLLMSLTWKNFLPSGLVFLVFIFWVEWLF
uniref:NADH-ubiquinone oxidoreductase chain 1 n=1 Tax=Cuspidaria undata TaxID=2952366 RepID=A0AAT9T5U6_9BIVA|nr:NADH dehydrogenase subunit 1 [Cuspidaria undata]USF19208.1 NADH dehydrogenase subunit 1 [Cuspidaria undata]